MLAKAPISRSGENGTFYSPPISGNEVEFSTFYVVGARKQVLSSLGNINRQNSCSSGVWGGWPVKVNKMCGDRGFKAISDERARNDGPFSVNF